MVFCCCLVLNLRICNSSAASCSFRTEFTTSVVEVNKFYKAGYRKWSDKRMSASLFSSFKKPLFWHLKVLALVHFHCSIGLFIRSSIMRKLDYCRSISCVYSWIFLFL
ncbi:hypothetical protein O6H91_06G124000 [Diphasiastrum complanatum]|uniref:Uncharacterized protein n=1 Tax=Diphasiastrum complanatum TaxID=34168 RepID=A0ACC2DII7_DIPCM|nr:hypothetical protein O6H91_06G124000 [Diphasiastrum complanatum]